MEKSTVYRPEIAGIRGIASIIVLLGHSMACIFPAVYFGKTFTSHSVIENVIHNTPLNLLFNGSAMVMIFFIISGYFIGNKNCNTDIINIVVKRYIRYMPMVFVGILFGAFVMYINAVNSIALAEYSYAGRYVKSYNNFIPHIFGHDGVVLEALVKVFIVGSDYNNVLWYISISFLGEITFNIILKFFKNSNKKKFFIYGSIIFLWIAGIRVWQLQYLSGMAIGILIAIIEPKMSDLKAEFCFILGIILLSFEDKSPSGIYTLLQYIPKLIVPIWSLAGGLVLIGIMNCNKLSEAFCNKKLLFIGKYSFGIYAIQWPIIISISCGSCFLLLKSRVNYGLSGMIGILVGLIITVLFAAVIQDKIYTPVYKKLLEIWEKIYIKYR